MTLPSTKKKKKIIFWGQYGNTEKINSHLHFNPQPSLPKHFKIAKHFKLQAKNAWKEKGAFIKP